MKKKIKNAVIINRLKNERIPWRAFIWGPQQDAAMETRNILKKPTAGLSESLKVFFAIPIISKKKAKDWHIVCSLLARTLDALISQSDKNWQAIVCGQDKPENLHLDPRVNFIEFKEKEDTDLNRMDKFDKIRCIVKNLEADIPRDGYFHVLDQDDTLHRDVVSYMLNKRDPNGYIINSGFMLAADKISGRYLSPRNLLRFKFLSDTIPESCGSCMACHFDTRFPEIGFNFFNSIPWESHGAFEHLALILGRKLDVVPYPALLYNILHGENGYEGRRPPPILSQKHLKYIKAHF